MLIEEGLVVAERYRLTNRFASGRLGSLWRGIDMEAGREVAIRMVDRKLPASMRALETFIEESDTARSLRSQFVTEVVEAGRTIDGTVYVVTELLRPELLHELLARLGRLPTGVALRMIADLAAAAREAHSLMLVHRGIDPQSVLLHQNDEGAIVPKLVEFGRTRLLRSVGREAPARNVHRSPEVRANELRVGPPSDVWALGALLLRCLSGAPPSDSDDLAAELAAATRLHPEVRALIERCIVRSPTARIDAATLAHDARALLKAHGSSSSDLAKLVHVPERSWANVASETSEIDGSWQDEPPRVLRTSAFARLTADGRSASELANDSWDSVVVLPVRSETSGEAPRPQSLPPSAPASDVPSTAKETPKAIAAIVQPVPSAPRVEQVEPTPQREATQPANDVEPAMDGANRDATDDANDAASDVDAFASGLRPPPWKKRALLTAVGAVAAFAIGAAAAPRPPRRHPPRPAYVQAVQPEAKESTAAARAPVQTVTVAQASVAPPTQALFHVPAPQVKPEPAATATTTVPTVKAAAKPTVEPATNPPTIAAPKVTKATPKAAAAVDDDNPYE